jgi:hypothetical protein
MALWAIFAQGPTCLQSVQKVIRRGWLGCVLAVALSKSLTEHLGGCSTLLTQKCQKSVRKNSLFDRFMQV